MRGVFHYVPAKVYTSGMKKKIILYLVGGAMAGVFGSGVVSSLEEEDFYDNIEAVYAGSSGVIIGAYFLTKQARWGSSISFEELTKNFIKISNIFRFKSILDIDLLMDLIENKKKLDIDKLKSQRIPLFVKLLNANTGEIDYLDIRKQDDVIKTLRASVSVGPYAFFSQIINKKKYIDGGLDYKIPIKQLLKKYPEHKIVIVFNKKPTQIFRVKEFIYDALEATVMFFAYGLKVARVFMSQQEDSIKTYKLASKSDRVIIIHPPKGNKVNFATTNPTHLFETYEMGKKAGKDLIDLLKNQ